MDKIEQHNNVQGNGPESGLIGEVMGKIMKSTAVRNLSVAFGLIAAATANTSCSETIDTTFHGKVEPFFHGYKDVKEVRLEGPAKYKTIGTIPVAELEGLSPSERQRLLASKFPGIHPYFLKIAPFKLIARDGATHACVVGLVTDVDRHRMIHRGELIRDPLMGYVLDAAKVVGLFKLADSGDTINVSQKQQQKQKQINDGLDSGDFHPGDGFVPIDGVLP